MQRSTGKPFTVYSALCKLMYMLTCKYKKRSLPVLFLTIEALSIVVDQFGKTKLLAVLAAFLLSALGFAITLVNCIKRSAKPQKAKQLEVVEFVFSLIQLVATFLHFVLTVSHVKYNYHLSMFLPLAFAVIAVIFAFKNNGEHGHSQSRHLPFTFLPLYNSEPDSSHNESDQIRIIIHTLNNSMPGSTPIEPDGQIWTSFDDESEELLLPCGIQFCGVFSLKCVSSCGFLESIIESLSLFALRPPKHNITPFMLGSTPIEPDGQIWNSSDEESEGLRLIGSELVRLLGHQQPFNCPIKLYFDKDHWLYTKLSWQTEGLKESEKQLIKEILHITEPQASTSMPYKRIAHLRDGKPVTNPVADVFARPFATVRRRKNFQHRDSVAEST